jgi:hypothetical protein
MEVSDEWFEKCPRRFDKAECMYSISAEMVMDAIEKAMFPFINNTKIKGC